MQRKTLIITAFGLLLITAMLTSARVFSFQPDVPWWRARLNAPVGGQFRVYCTADDYWAVMGFRQFAAKKCAHYTVKNQSGGIHLIPQEAVAGVPRYRRKQTET